MKITNPLRTLTVLALVSTVLWTTLTANAQEPPPTTYDEEAPDPMPPGEPAVQGPSSVDIGGECILTAVVPSDMTYSWQVLSAQEGAVFKEVEGGKLLVFFTGSKPGVSEVNLLVCGTQPGDKPVGIRHTIEVKAGQAPQPPPVGPPVTPPSEPPPAPPVDDEDSLGITEQVPQWVYSYVQEDKQQRKGTVSAVYRMLAKREYKTTAEMVTQWSKAMPNALGKDYDYWVDFFNKGVQANNSKLWAAEKLRTVDDYKRSYLEIAEGLDNTADAPPPPPEEKPPTNKPSCNKPKLSRSTPRTYNDVLHEVRNTRAQMSVEDKVEDKAESPEWRDYRLKLSMHNALKRGIAAGYRGTSLYSYIDSSNNKSMDYADYMRARELLNVAARKDGVNF